MPLHLVLYVSVILLHVCLTRFVWRRVVLRFFDPKQLLRVLCIWCWFAKCSQYHWKCQFVVLLVAFLFSWQKWGKFVYFFISTPCLQYTLCFMHSLSVVQLRFILFYYFIYCDCNETEVWEWSNFNFPKITCRFLCVHVTRIGMLPSP